MPLSPKRIGSAIVAFAVASLPSLYIMRLLAQYKGFTTEPEKFLILWFEVGSFFFAATLLGLGQRFKNIAGTFFVVFALLFLTLWYISEAIGEIGGLTYRELLLTVSGMLSIALVCSLIVFIVVHSGWRRRFRQ